MPCKVRGCELDDGPLRHSKQHTDPVSSDVVNSPSHYRSTGSIEAIDVIEQFQLGYHLGNVAKYLLRAGKKGEKLEDLQKARWYLNREIKNMGGT
jgi:hypothetical protein